jgi:cytochrome c553
MRLTVPVTALCAVLIALAFTATGWARQRVWRVAAESGFEGKADYCRTCHGLSGEGYRGYYPMPRLAGQQPKYIENQLRAFIERRRVNPVMFNVAHALSPAMLEALTQYFYQLNPPPIGGATGGNLGLGRTIYEEGLPEANIAACSACHGPEAKGHEEIPRLAGQLYPYTVKALSGWTRERGQGGAGRSDASAIMVPTTHNLTPAQISALAAYLSTLR